jgi:ABC-type branched-subunit amino acid transport system ATPase component
MGISYIPQGKSIFPHMNVAEHLDIGAWILKSKEEKETLLLDEPSFGLSPKVVGVVFESLKQILREGVTVFLVGQNARKALENSDRGYVMEMGRIQFVDNSQSLLQNEEVRRSYLGGKAGAQC